MVEIGGPQWWLASLAFLETSFKTKQNSKYDTFQIQHPSPKSRLPVTELVWCASLLRGTKREPLAAAEGHCITPELEREESVSLLFPINTLEQRP